jgi:hypothetical protein
MASTLRPIAPIERRTPISRRRSSSELERVLKQAKDTNQRPNRRDRIGQGIQNLESGLVLRFVLLLGLD